jgi:hypothetical protein
MAQNSKKLKTGNPTENIKHEINKLLGVSWFERKRNFRCQKA